MLMLGCWSLPAAAAWPGRGYEIARRYAAAGQSVSRDKAAQIAQGHIKGRILSVKRAGDTWRVKLLSKKGEVHVVVVDARSGEVISPE